MSNGDVAYIIPIHPWGTILRDVSLPEGFSIIGPWSIPSQLPGLMTPLADLQLSTHCNPHIFLDIILHLLLKNERHSRNALSYLDATTMYFKTNTKTKR